MKCSVFALIVPQRGRLHHSKNVLARGLIFGSEASRAFEDGVIGTLNASENVFFNTYKDDIRTSKLTCETIRVVQDNLSVCMISLRQTNRVLERQIRDTRFMSQDNQNVSFRVVSASQGRSRSVKALVEVKRDILIFSYFLLDENKKEKKKVETKETLSLFKCPIEKELKSIN